MGACNRMPLRPSMEDGGGEERRMESSAQPQLRIQHGFEWEECAVASSLKHPWTSDSGGL